MNRMGVFRVRIRFYSLADEARGRMLDLIVDTGATYSVIPKDVAASLGARPERRLWFTLADGNRISREIGHIGIDLDGLRLPTIVVLGEPGDPVLLGAVTLEELGYTPDPVTRTLRPATQYLLSLA